MVIICVQMISRDSSTIGQVGESEECDKLAHLLDSISIHSIANDVPIVLLQEINFSFVDVMAFFMKPKRVIMRNWELFCETTWDNNGRF